VAPETFPDVHAVICSKKFNHFSKRWKLLCKWRIAFQQYIKATRGDGYCLLSPHHNGLTMATIHHTHGYDLLFKLGAMFGGMILVCFVGEMFIGPLTEPLEQWLKGNDLEWVWTILALSYGIAGYAGVIMLLTMKAYWLPTYLHVRFSLSTRITSDEAKRLNFLFDGSLAGGKWYPLESIRKVAPEFRREALFRFANKVADGHGWHRPFTTP
jgi:hypothetical protein